MSKLSVYNFITMNGFFAGPGGDTSWHIHGEEEAAYSEEQLAAEHTLIFGRVTYEHMIAFWPTPEAAKTMPVMAKRMNAAEKIVFSRTLDKAEWQNTRVVKDDLEGEIGRLKKTSKKDLTILGSGTIVTQLAKAGLIDEYEIMVDPVALGDGTPIFKGLTHKLNLKLRATRAFKSGVVLLSYGA